MNFPLDVPANFNFWRTVYSHGWSSLPPFNVDKENKCLKRVLRLQTGKILPAEITRLSKRILNIATPEISSKEKKEAAAQLRACFRLEEEFSEFYSEVNKLRDFQWVSQKGAGRLLRSPTVFEDVVKMICTTNCSWALTEIMAANFCRKLGLQIDDGGWTFPEPEAIADKSEHFLRKEIRAGYRAPYFLELSRRIVKDRFDVESWRDSTLPTAELFKEVRSVKGVGPYAAGNILKLLGRYDYLGIDSWCRKKFFEIHRDGRTASDKVIEKHYERFGKWQGLFFWMDVTREWYDRKFPF